MRRWKQLLFMYRLYRRRKQKKNRHSPQGKLLAKIAKEIEIPKKKVYFCGRNSNPTTNEKDSIIDCPCSDDAWRHGARLLLEGKERNEKRLLFKVKRNQTM